MSKLSEKIKLCRKQKSLTQKNLADLIGVSRQTISSYESGRTEPDIYSLEKLSNIFELSLDTLILNETDLSPRRIHKLKIIFLSTLIIINTLILIRNCLIFTLNNKYPMSSNAILTNSDILALSVRIDISNVIKVSEFVFIFFFNIGIILLYLYINFYKIKCSNINKVKSFVAAFLSVAVQTAFFIIIDSNTSFYDYFHVIITNGILSLQVISAFLIIFIAKIIFSKKMTGGEL